MFSRYFSLSFIASHADYILDTNKLDKEIPLESMYFRY